MDVDIHSERDGLSQWERLPRVILRLTPADDMALNVPVTGNIGINCENGSGISLPCSIEPVSETYRPWQTLMRAMRYASTLLVFP